MDSKKDHAFVVEREDGSVITFSRALQGRGKGLFRSRHNAARGKGLNGVTLVNTVVDNKSRYTKEEVSLTERARTLQKIIGLPSTKDFIRYITQNQLPNCPITKQDIVNAEAIYGPDIGCLKGKTRRLNPPRVRITRSALPPEDMERHRQVTVCADIMYVNSIPFFISISRKVKFGTVEELRSNKMPVVMEAIKRMIGAYHTGGFRVGVMLMDGEFEPYKPALAQLTPAVTLETTSRDEHQGDIERYIETIKQRVRGMFNTMPFKSIPPRVVARRIVLSYSRRRQESIGATGNTVTEANSFA